jgi:hypothetical protein
MISKDQRLNPKLFNSVRQVLRLHHASPSTLMTDLILLKYLHRAPRRVMNFASKCSTSTLFKKTLSSTKKILTIPPRITMQVPCPKNVHKMNVSGLALNLVNTSKKMNTNYTMILTRNTVTSKELNLSTSLNVIKRRMVIQIHNTTLTIKYLHQSMVYQT